MINYELLLRRIRNAVGENQKNKKLRNESYFKKGSKVKNETFNLSSIIVYYSIDFTKSTSKFRRQINKSWVGELLIGRAKF